MAFKSNVAAPLVNLDSRIPSRGLVLVSSRKPNGADGSARLAGPLLSASQMRHNFAIWALEKSGTSRGHLHVYYCVRCKWSFLVNDHSGLVTPLDQNGNPIRKPDSAAAAASFGVWPGPVFKRVTGNRRVRPGLAPAAGARGRLAALRSAA